MKKNYILRYLFIFLLISGTSLSASSQTTLGAGDIAFTGYISNTAGLDTFSFVLLKDIAINTPIVFTDNAWQSTSSFTATEGIITWTSGTALVLGTEVKIFGLIAQVNGVANGTVANTQNATSGLSLSTTGDQVIAYQGSAATPTFVGAIHMNVFTLAADGFDSNPTNWDGSHAVNSNYCFLPTGLVSTPNANPTALWFSTESDNAKLTTCPSGGAGSVQALRNAIYNTANWTQTDGSGNLSLPSGCFFFVLPAHLIKFTAINKFSNVELAWQSDNEINFSHYEIERSFNGTDFTTAGSVRANNYAGTSNYTFTDNDGLKSAASIIYYRLKMVDKDGTFKYSPVATVKNKKDAAFFINNLVNPVKDKISFSISTQSSGKLSIQLTDMNGKLITSRSQNAANGVTAVSLDDAAGLASGLYLLKINFLNNTEVIKLVKQ